jgi:hypothetical protein
MKTAMQELKIWIDDQVNLGFLDKKYSERLKWYIGYYFLEKEKEQICNAYTDGLGGPYIGAGEYYNKEYKA